MAGSVNTNTGAQIALQNLNVTGTDLAGVQKRISTGLKVADAFDNGAVFAIAQGLRSDITAISAVNGQLGGAKGLLSVTDAALTGISHTLQDVRGVLL
jgi:flagellin